MGLLSEIDAAANIWIKIKRLFIKDKFEKQCEDYYYEEFNKKIYVRKNGDGVIVSSFRIKIIDASKIDYLIRTLDIHDAKSWAELKKLKEMKECSINDVFSKVGFWYSCDNNIISDIEEFYQESEMTKQDDNKFISIKITFDTSVLQNGKSYNFSYAYSIPGLFPINEGRFDVDDTDRNKYPEFASYASTNDIGHHMCFSAYFENGIDFKDRPVGYAVRHKNNVKIKNKKEKKEKIPCVCKDNIFYKKFRFEVKSPRDYEYICMKWNVKNPSNI